MTTTVAQIQQAADQAAVANTETIVNDSAEGTELENLETELQTETDQPVQEIQQPDPVAQKLGEFEKQLTDLRMENAYLRGQIIKPTVANTETAVVNEDDPYPDDEVVEQGLRTNPAATIKQLLQHAERRGEKRVEKKFTNAQRQQLELQQGFMNDDQAFTKNYGEVFETNPEFNKMTNAVYNGLVQQFGNVPGLKTMAAATAYGQMVRQGKINPQPVVTTTANPNGGLSNVTNIRRVQQANPQVSTQPGARPITNPKDPLNGFSKEEQASIRRVCSDLGLTIEDWRKSYDAAKKDNPEYA